MRFIPTHIHRVFLGGLLGALLFCACDVYAEEISGGMTLTVMPPLFQINLQPGETWTSGIQVVNGNSYDLTVYAEPVPFHPAGEDGKPLFENVSGTRDPNSLAGWIVLPQGPLTIGREKTFIVPLAITVPKDASPGGHYAAVLIGNRAPEGAREGDTVAVTSSIASLILLRVAGAVDERGRIRDFATEQSVYDTAEAHLSLRFENMGNVHLQPKGDITIYNMFGKKRGYIPVQSGEYGNVMPGSIRKFEFSWSADSGEWDIGRYRAEATVGYGAESKQFAQATTYFYILPIMPLIEVGGGLIALLVFVGWALRAYIRRAISIESRHAGETSQIEPEIPTPEDAKDAKIDIRTLVRPIKVGMVDMRRAVYGTVLSTSRSGTQTQGVEHMTLTLFFSRYRYFFIFVCACAVAWLAASAFFADVLTVERVYEVHEVRKDTI